MSLDNLIQQLNSFIPVYIVIPTIFSLFIFLTISKESLSDNNQPDHKNDNNSSSTSSNTSKASKLFQKTEPSEFGGPIGAGFMPYLLPGLLYFLYFSCNDDQVVGLLCPWDDNFLLYKKNPFANGFISFLVSIFDFRVFCIYSCWVFAQWALYLIVPGPIINGTPLNPPHRDVKLPYRINAARCNFISVVGAVILSYFNIISPSYAYDNFLPLMTSAWLFSLYLSIYLYVTSRWFVFNDQQQINDHLNLLSITGNSGNPFYDFWMGRTLNPRIGMLDLKYVCELRPGLILWQLINYSAAAAQYQRSGSISISMILVCCFQAYYVWDSHFNEPAILTTMDITTDGFGFMLAFGDLAWVPFTYTMQARYLVQNDPHLSYYTALCIIILKLLGLYIFRSSNSQKNMFRTNPNDPACAHLEFITTKTGRKLICSSWWGMSRHINYFGDILMAISWSLPCGFGSILPYFYPIYFAALLYDRQRRDDDKCKRQYGADWDRYCERVPYKIIPYLY